MQRGVNKVIIVGNLGQDPEIRYTPTGKPVCSLSVATSEVWKDKNTGQDQERTEWHRIILWNRLGEIANQYLRKGAKVYIEGKLQTRKWQDQSGQDRYTTEIIAETLQMLDRQQNNGTQPAQTAQPPQAQGGGFEDDIPFMKALHRAEHLS